MAKVSIIMPFRNAGLHLKACLDSIIGQTHKEWELLAVNDHSTDQGEAIVIAYSEQDTRIKLLRNEGKGITPALQTGYRASIGDYVTRMDADDLMPPNKLQLLYSALVEEGRGYLATGLVKYFADYPIGDGFLKYAEWLNKLTITATHYDEIYKECPVASPNWLVHRADFNEAGAFDTDYYPEDYNLVFNWLKADLRIRGIEEVTHLWRDHSQRASRNDPNYLDNKFTNLKVTYFAKLHYQGEKCLYLWGAGRRGKAVAKELIELAVPFTWITTNNKKIGLDIYEQKIYHPDALEADSQVIIAVSQQGAAEAIKTELAAKNIDDFYFFC